MALGVLFVCASAYYGYFLSQPVVPVTQGFYYNFTAGSPLQSLLKELQIKGDLKHPLLFKVLIYLRAADRRVQAGEYYFPPATTPNQLIDILLSGKVLLHKVTLVEGWTVIDILSAMQKNKHLKHTLATQLPLQLCQHPYRNYEGLFLAETYEFPAGLSDRDLLLWAYRLRADSLQSAWKGRAQHLPYKTAYQALIAASLIEKETANDEERFLISSVIVNRLRRGMRLQIDPSVIYGLYHKFVPILSKFDLRINTAYNTYLHKGLPPTPIALPSNAALQAALHPASTDYLFFVLKNDGKHYFSTSYQQHRGAVRRFRQAHRYHELFGDLR
jgi:peptidoglycan lytic transglycosylase G